MVKTDRVKVRTRKSTKRKFAGNQFTRKSTSTPLQEEQLNDEVTDQPMNNHAEPIVKSPQKTASSSKIECIETDTPKKKDKFITGYRFLDMEILSSIVSMLCCPICQSCTLKLHETFIRKMGFSSLLIIKCETHRCKFEEEFYTSNPARRGFDINSRIIYAMRSIGQGHASIKKFTALMNMPAPMTVKNYDKVVKTMAKVVEGVAKQTMSEAAHDLKLTKGQHSGDGVVDVPVTCDGSWQRRGFASFNGTFTSISLDTGKILDIAVMSRYCKGCKSRENLKKTNNFAYETWRLNHDCQLNHVGSAGAMEVTGAKQIFSRSIAKHGLRYNQYLGDGDSKGFSSITKTYEGIEVEKLECVGHVQKRVGNRLRNLKKNVKGLGGRGRLTNNLIDRLQNYYGIAIRSNVGDLEGMKKATCAVLFHVASSKMTNYHSAYCPTGVKSWCKFQQDIALGTTTYKPGCGFPLDVIKHVKPIFSELSQETLLKKCLHGKTQNQNESFNQLIWERLPKSRYVSLTQLKFGSFDAVAHFNIGMKSSILVFEKLKMVPGRYMTKQCSNLNLRRLSRSLYKKSEPVRKRRKMLRGAVKSGMDINEHVEGKVYEAGGFD